MEKSVLSNTIASFNSRTFKFICATAAISLPILGMWVLGVPGVQNQYAIGWALGLKTLCDYLIGCCISLIVYIIISKIANKYTSLLHLNLVVISAFWVLFVHSAFNLYQALAIVFSAT
jgi:hypothetical protein